MNVFKILYTFKKNYEKAHLYNIFHIASVFV